jgi:hypothetical protein
MRKAKADYRLARRARIITAPKAKKAKAGTNANKKPAVTVDNIETLSLL